MNATKTLTQTQRDCLDYMDRHSLGAVMFEGSWRFKEAFRRDAEMSERFKARMIHYPESPSALQVAGLLED